MTHADFRTIELQAAAYAAERDARLVHEGERRRTQGIVHTPPELARAVVRFSDALLRDRLQLSRGICEPSLLLLDPACGPGAFLAAAFALAQARSAAAQPVGAVQAIGFDVDPAALAWAERLREHPQASALELSRADVLASEAIEPRVRAHAGPLLIVGNPPWTSARAHPSQIDQARLAGFRLDASGARLPERKLGVLSDAYVRFFALCAQLARGCDAGALVGLVTNASFLDGPVHRGMRARLLEWFDEVYVLDLGGSALLGRQRSVRDDNVFGVRPSVAVTWLCRYPIARRRPGVARALYARRLGSKADKLNWLAEIGSAAEDQAVRSGVNRGVDAKGIGAACAEAGATAHVLPWGGAARPAASHTLAELGMVEHACEAPAHSFTPRPRRDARYSSFLPLPDWLPFHREGVQSNRDAVVVDDTPDRLLSRLRAFVRGETWPELEPAYRWLPHYDPQRARRALAEALERDPDGARGIVLQRLSYRPLHERVFCPIPPLCHRPRPLLAAALSHGGLVLISARKDRGDLPWAHAGVAACVVDNCFLSTRSSCRARAFPAYTPDGSPNLAPKLMDLLGAAGCASASVKQVQLFLLSVLSASGYRRCWDQELHHDYPRVPLPPDLASFQRLVGLGEQLAHLYTVPSVQSEATRDVAPASLFKDIELDLHAGEVRLQGEVVGVGEPGPHGALALRVGHHRPLAAYISQRASQRLDAQGLAEVIARLARLSALVEVTAELDRVMSEVFGRFDRT